MIEKMRFISLTGPRDDIDRVVEKYLLKYDVQLENALTELGSTTGLTPFREANPYEETLRKAEKMAEDFADILGNPADEGFVPGHSVDHAAEAAKTIESLDAKLGELRTVRDKIRKERDAVKASYDMISPFTGLGYDVSSILRFKSVLFRFGKMPKEFFSRFLELAYDNVDAIQIPCREADDYVWLVYFTPEARKDKVDAIYSSMHFERIYIPDEYIGTPKAASDRLRAKLDEEEGRLRTQEDMIRGIVKDHAKEIRMAKATLEEYREIFGVRRYAACTKHDEHTFYIICGWMTEKDAKRLDPEIEKDDRVFALLEDHAEKEKHNPPTLLKNIRLFRPFEMFTRMYGVPAYNEMDPTWLVAITYSVLFGFMFGDLGQGLCLLIGGMLLYAKTGNALTGILACCGVFSSIFGFLFGSVFGFEDIIPARWLRPAKAMMRIPAIGELNTVFVVAIAIGMGLILLVMLLNVINAARTHTLGEMMFSANGIAGMIFYGAIVLMIVLFVTGHTMPAGWLLAVLIVIPLLLQFFREPLSRAIEKRKENPEEKTTPVMFFVQGFFELFEVLLSYFSNTLSFVRVGAFAVSHAAMMNVVLMLAGVESGNTNWAVVVLGNLFVCGMEGLVVGIQVLRLEYYELFSRFYHGNGREFKANI